MGGHLNNNDSSELASQKHSVALFLKPPHTRTHSPTISSECRKGLTDPELHKKNMLSEWKARDVSSHLPWPSLGRRTDHGFTVTWTLSGCGTPVIRAGAEQKTSPEWQTVAFYPQICQRAIKITNQLLHCYFISILFISASHQMTKLHFENCAG